MNYWGRFGIVLLGMAVLVVIWAAIRWVVVWFRPRLDGFESGVVAVIVMIVLAVAASVASIQERPPNSGRCGLGTVRIEERVWAGKGYRTEAVCIVDQAR